MGMVTFEVGARYLFKSPTHWGWDITSHILGLSAAAQAAIGLGDSEAARGFYQTLVDNYANEAAQTREEYLAHGNSLEAIRTTAQTYVTANWTPRRP